MLDKGHFITGDYAYTIIETNDVVDMNDFEALENVIKVRVIE